MSDPIENADLLPGAPLSRAVALVRRLTWLYGIYLAVLGLMLVSTLTPGRGLQARLGLSRELLLGGLGETALLAVLLSLVALLAAGLMTNSRLWHRRAEAALAAGEIDQAPPSLMAILWKRGPGFLAREGQAVLVPAGALVMAIIAWLLWPKGVAPAPVSHDANLVAALIIGLAFPSLVAERMMSTVPAEQMPEAPGLRRLLLLTTLILAAAGLAEIGRGLNHAWSFKAGLWTLRILSATCLLMAAEMAGRALARLFLPRPSPESARAASDSMVATVLTAGPRSPGALIRTHLGLDFTRSWAIKYISAAAVPFLVGTTVFCWLLTGAKLLNADQRGVYERFGAPVDVLGPGFHLVMPWPLGRVRPVEYGTVHTIAAGIDDGVTAYDKAAASELIGAEAIPPASLNRMWDTSHATEALYLVANLSNEQQGFQVVNTEILVLYRTGLTDKAAMEAVYGAADQAKVVAQEADRLALRYFSSHTLDGVMGAERDNLQDTLRAELTQAVNGYHVGAEIVAVLVNEIHPPAAAAAAYHHVQAAGIEADTSAFQATGHAFRSAGQALQESQQATAAAEAAAVEKTEAAIGDAYQFNADQRAYNASPQAFLLERRARNLIAALKGRHLMIVDRRLSGSQIPVIDLRAGAAPAPSGDPAVGAANARPYAPEAPPASSSERAPPE